MWHKHHQEARQSHFDPKSESIGGLKVPLEDIKAWAREFKAVGASDRQIEALVDAAAINAFIAETERRYGAPLDPEERDFATKIFLEV